MSLKYANLASSPASRTSWRGRRQHTQPNSTNLVELVVVGDGEDHCVHLPQQLDVVGRHVAQVDPPELHRHLCNRYCCVEEVEGAVVVEPPGGAQEVD